MSDTTGWEALSYDPECLVKVILGNRFHCKKHGDQWRLIFSIQCCATRPTLRECQLVRIERWEDEG